MTNKTIFKNTISLYFRMFVLTLISLYTVRVVLNVLGADDYGIYNVVGGFVTFFSFVSATLTSTSQRFFSLHLAKKDWDNVNVYFSTNVLIYIIIGTVMLLFMESAGMWFLLNKLIYESARQTAIIIVYEFSICTFLLGLIVAPYQALLVADENMSIYSGISILEGIMKLVIVYAINVIDGDKLVIYSLLQLCVVLIVNCIYILYTKKHYNKLKLSIIKNTVRYKEVMDFAKWNLIGALATVGKNQGVNVIMNMNFGTRINAARGIASSINSVASSFSANFMKAIDPHITKIYTLGHKGEMCRVMSVASRVSFFLMTIISLPLIKNIDYILTIWLENAPDYTGLFAQLVLIDTLILSISEPVGTVVYANGKVRLYQIVVSFWTLLNLPVSWFGLIIFNNPTVPFYISILITIMVVIMRSIVLGRIDEIDMKKYFMGVYPRVIISLTLSTSLTMVLFEQATNIVMLVRNLAVSAIIIGGICFAVGFNTCEKRIIIRSIVNAKKVSS